MLRANAALSVPAAFSTNVADRWKKLHDAAAIPLVAKRRRATDDD